MAAVRNASLALAASVALYVLTWEFGWNIPPIRAGIGTSIRSPGNCCSCSALGARSAAPTRLAPALRSPVTLGLAVAYLLFAFAVTLTWHFPRLAIFVPHWLGDWMYPIDKTNLDVLRFAHFLALAVITVRFVPRDWPALQSPWLRPAIMCGQHSLEIFCLGVFLAFAAHFVMVEVYDGIASGPGQHRGSSLWLAGAGCSRGIRARRRRSGSPKRRRMPTSLEARHESVDRLGARSQWRARFVQAVARCRGRRSLCRAGLSLFGDSLLQRVAAAVAKARRSTSWCRWNFIELPGPDGPACLSGAAGSRAQRNACRASRSRSRR